MRGFLKTTVIPFMAAMLIVPSAVGTRAHADAAEDNNKLTFNYLTAFVADGTFTPPTTGKYKIYVVGKSGDGAPKTTSNNGGGGGGSGGIAISILKLDKNTAYPITVSNERSEFGTAGFYATAGENGSEQTGGSGGIAIGGNYSNESGYKGGTGGTYGYTSEGNGKSPTEGTAGDNGGMAGGNKGSHPSNSYWAGYPYSGGGGGGGARLPDQYCSYVVPPFTSTYKASGGLCFSSGYSDNYKTWPSNDPVPYPNFFTGPTMKLYGGGGGNGGGYNNQTAGTPGVVIIEQCTDQTAPTINTVGFSADAKAVTITATDESDGSGVYGIYINGELRTGSTVNYSIPSGVMSLSIYAEDYAGNVSSIWTEPVPDKIPPEIKTVEFSEDAKTATIAVTDEGNSGLKGIYVNGNLELIESGMLVYSIPEGVYTLILKVIDNAGNQSEEVTKAVPDVVPPTIEDVSFSEDAKTATIRLADVGSSGIKGVYVNDVFKFADSQGIVSVYIPDEVLSLVLQAMDNAGNKSEIQTVVVPDVIPPTIESCTFSNGGLSAVIIASDKGNSGLKGIYINGEFFEGGEVNYTLPQGVYDLKLQAEDNAGNKSEIRTETVPDNIPPVIESIVFSSDNSFVRITITDEGGSKVKGATINGEFVVGAVIDYDIPSGTKYLLIQAEDNLGNTSEVINRRVPGWSQIVDTITFKPVEFRENNKIATITAETSLPNTTIAGIYINDVLYPANPTIYKVPDGLTTMQLQAVNNEGDKSVIYNVDVPAWGGGVRITSVSFSEQNDYSKKNMEAYIKAVDDTGHNIKGIYVNGEFFEGDAITYTILNGTRHLEIQAINTNGDTSEVVIKRVPGWSEVVDTLSIESVTFASSGIATITAASTGAAVSGVYVNDKFYDGNPVLYTVSSGTKTLKLQAENQEGDKSAVIYKEVSYADTSPIVSTLAISAVDFDGSIATVKATSTGADVSGIYVNDKLYDGNPVLYPVSSSTKTLKTQAVNIMGERSPVVYKEVPSTSSSSSTSTTTSGKARISISAPDWTSAKKAKVKIAVSDSNDIDTVTASTDYGTEEDVTDEDYIYITKDTTVKVEVKNKAGEITKKSTSIECFDRDAPTVSVSQSDKILNIKASDAKSGVAAIYIKGKKYPSSGQVSYNIPDGATSVTIYAEDEAGNKSDAIEYPLKKEDKPVTAVPVAGAVTSVTPTPTAPAPEPEPEADGEIQAEEEPEYEQPFINLLGDVPEGLKDKKPSMAGVVGSIAAMVLSLGGIGAWMWHNHKKAGQSIELDDMEDLDIDYDQEEQNPDDAEDGTEDNDNVVDFNNERKVSSL